MPHTPEDEAVTARNTAYEANILQELAAKRAQATAEATAKAAEVTKDAGRGVITTIRSMGILAGITTAVTLSPLVPALPAVCIGVGVWRVWGRLTRDLPIITRDPFEFMNQAQSAELENAVEKSEDQIFVGLTELDGIKQTIAILEDHAAEISRNPEFVIETTVAKSFKQHIGEGINVTKCMNCNHICHWRCAIPNDAGKKGCWAMNSEGYCTQCEGKCFWKFHVNRNYTWEYGEVKKTTTLHELKEKHLKSSNGNTTVQAVVVVLKADCERVGGDILKQIEGTIGHLNGHIKNGPNPKLLTVIGYIDTMAVSEKSEAKCRWEQRVYILKAIIVRVRGNNCYIQ